MSTQHRKPTGPASTAALAVALAAALVAQAACTPREPRNVVLITLDTLRSDRLSAWGHSPETSPALDALAHRGVTFREAVAQATTTPPSHASILTGQNPPTHGLRKLYGQRLPAANRTLAEILKDEGYATAAFVSAVPLRAETGLDQGFDLYDDDWQSPDVADGEEQPHERSAEQTNDAVFAWLDTATEPFFLWVHYFDPHWPYFPPEEYRERFGVEGVAREFLPGPIDPTKRSRRKPLPADVVEKMRALYDAEIAYTDAAVAHLLDELERRGLLAHAAIAVVADHGEMLGEYGYFFGHWGVTDETARVPMLLVHPEGRYAGAVATTTVATIDLVPTLLAWLGVDADVHFDGRDLTPLLEGEELEPRAVYTEQFEYFPVRAVRNDEWILEQQAPKNERIATGLRALYRRTANGFPRALAPTDPVIAQALGEEMDAVLRSPVRHPSERQQVADDVREQLRALGYTDEAGAPD